jgi:hypothetical protein
VIKKLLNLFGQNGRFVTKELACETSGMNHCNDKEIKRGYRLIFEIDAVEVECNGDFLAPHDLNIRPTLYIFFSRCPWFFHKHKPPSPILTRTMHAQLLYFIPSTILLFYLFRHIVARKFSSHIDNFVSRCTRGLYIKIITGALAN